jgi:hypothetical protein
VFCVGDKVNQRSVSQTGTLTNPSVHVWCCNLHEQAVGVVITAVLSKGQCCSLARQLSPEQDHPAESPFAHSKRCKHGQLSEHPTCTPCV